MRKKGGNGGKKEPDKSPGAQLPATDVPAFLSEVITPSSETQQMGHELFSTFAKGNPGAWMATTSPGVEIEELSDDEIPDLCSSSSASDEDECEQDDRSAPLEERHEGRAHLIYMAEATRPDLRLNRISWLLSIILHVLNTIWIEICNTTVFQYVIALMLLAITAN
eukprot:3934321-Rhodomonas_salina.1